MNINEIPQVLADLINEHNEEHNELIDTCNQMQARNIEMVEGNRKLIESLKHAKAKIEKMEEEGVIMARAAVELKRQNTDLKIQVKDFKAINPKKLQQHNKRLQAANQDAQKNIAQLKKECMEYRKERKRLIDIEPFGHLRKVHEDGAHTLYFWPTRTTHELPNGKMEDRQTLLYCHSDGIVRLVTLKDDEALLVKGTARPSKEITEQASQWLRRVKAQKWDVSELDLMPRTLK